MNSLNHRTSVRLTIASLASLARYARPAGSLGLRLGSDASAQPSRLKSLALRALWGTPLAHSKVLHGSGLASRVASRGMAKGRCATSHLPKEWGVITLPLYVLGGT